LKIKTSKPECIWQTKAFLGEGALWVKSLNSIYFTDIKRKKIFTFNTKTKRKKIIKINKEIGFLSHIKKNIFILGLKGELRIVNLKNNKKIKSIFIEIDKPLNRLNDGKTDPSGRLWFGSMDNLERNIQNGSLYCLNKNLKLKMVDNKYMITNGPAFINEKNFYHTDTKKRIIYKIKIDKNLNILEKKIFKKFVDVEGFPDGMTTDRFKNLWVCHFGGSSISVFNQKGKKIYKIKLPAKNVTNCAFGGANNNDLYITTALKGLKEIDKKKYNLSGSLFKVRTNSKGMTSKSFNVIYD
jgi:D-xylonolactonase|tara:strand:+ start:488 stop:1378 length:891 start_codon:yes stop_codon:yes gene_type:complete